MFYLDVDSREEIQADFVNEIRAKLQSAYVQAKLTDDTTLQALADKLNIDRSAVYRHLNGNSNLTSKTISDLSWALGKRPSFNLHDIKTTTVSTSTNNQDYSEILRKVTFSSLADFEVMKKNQAADASRPAAQLMSIAS